VPLHLGARTFDDDAFVVMAVINRTPDSFFDRGQNYAEAVARDSVAAAIADGADIVDIGGVKAGPGAPVDAAEELRRTVGFVQTVRNDHADIVISVDTWRSEVGDAVCRVGADLINDAWGGFDPRLAEVAAEHDAGLVCTHTGGAQPRTRPHRVAYEDVMADVVEHTVREAERAVTLGVRRDAVLLDPGHDFGKNTRHSLEVTRRLPQLAAKGWPVLVSLSHKDFVGETLDRDVDDRLAGTLAATALSAWLGARVFRVHDVRQTRDVVDLVASVRGTRPPSVGRRGQT